MKFLHHQVSWMVLAAYTVIACTFTFPLILNLSDGFVGTEMDSYNYAWNVYIFWKQLLLGQSPFSTQYIFYPHGGSLILHTYAPLISIPGVFFLSNLPLYLNLLALLSLVLSAFFAFKLTLYITRNKPASFVSGFLYGMSPIMFAFLESQHYYFAFAAPILPLGVYLLLRFFETFHYRFLSGVLLLIPACFFVDYYTTILYGFILVVFSLIYFCVHTDIFKKVFARVNLSKLCLTIFLAFVLPVFCIYFFLLRHAELGYRSGTNSYPLHCSANVAKYFIPYEYNPLLHGQYAGLMAYFEFDKNFDTPSYYVGIFAFVLAAVGLVFYKERKVVYVMSTMSVVVFLLTLGPQIEFGKTVLLKEHFTLFYWFAQLPFMSLIDCPQRFPIGFQLGIAVLAGFGISVLMQKYHKYARVIVAFILVFTLAEFFVTTIPFSKLSLPHVYRYLGELPNDKTVLEIPSGITESKGGYGYDWSIAALHTKQLFWQSVSDKPRVGGYLSRLPQEYYDIYKNEPVLGDIFDYSSLNGKWKPNFTDAEVSSFISKYNIGYIVLSPNSRRDEFEKVVEETFNTRIQNKIELEDYVLYILIER